MIGVNNPWMEGILVLQTHWQCATWDTIIFSNLSLRFHIFVIFVKTLQLVSINTRLSLLDIATFDYSSMDRKLSLFKQVGTPIQSSQFIIRDHNHLKVRCLYLLTIYSNPDITINCMFLSWKQVFFVSMACVNFSDVYYQFS